MLIRPMTIDDYEEVYSSLACGCPVRNGIK